MPMNNDPVLNRPMFNNSLAPTVQPFQAKGTGITSNVVSPDVGAKQLINTFGGAGMAGMSGPGYADGGSVRHFVEGGYNDVSETIDIGGPQAVMSADQLNKMKAAKTFDDRLRDLQEQQSRDPRSRGNLEADRRVRENQEDARAIGVPPSVRIKEAITSGAMDTFSSNLPSTEAPTTPDKYQQDYVRKLATKRGFNDTDIGQMQADLPNEGIRSVSPQMEEDVKPPASKTGEEQGPPMPPRASEREKRSGKGGLDLLLEDIKNRRAASAEEKENNKWMALMQAGLAIMGGRSSNAMQNIGAGGQQGAQAYAASEKDRRAEDRALFGEEAQVRLTQEKLAESADERAAQREMLTAKEKERLQERVLDREGRASDRGIAAINAIASQTRQELRDIATAAENVERDIIKYKTTMGIDPNEAKSEIEKLERRRQDLNDRYREVIERQDSVLGRQGQRVPERNQNFAGFKILGGAPKQ